MSVKFTLSFFVNGHSKDMTDFGYEVHHRMTDEMTDFFIEASPPISKKLLENICRKASEVAARIKKCQ
jgi:hypothetical protein